MPRYTICQFLHTNDTIPTTSNIGNAKYMNPPTTNPIKTSGNNTTVTMNFDIPQAALIPKINNFPNTQIMHIANNSDNIFPPHFIRLILAVFPCFQYNHFRIRSTHQKRGLNLVYFTILEK